MTNLLLKSSKLYQRKPSVVSSETVTNDLPPEIERLRPLTIEELENRPPRKMLVKDLLGVGEMSVWYGEPKCGKSFLVTHLGLAVALGLPWFDKKVMPGLVLYVAAEGAGGFAKRIEAYKKRQDINGALFRVILSSINLLDCNADVEPLIHWATQTKARLVVIDTLSRALAGGNENSSEDMGSFIANCDRIREATGAHILIIHHKPKGNNNTPRGHSSLFGATDALILVEKTGGGNVVTVEASKDDEDGWRKGFSLEVEEVGEDDDGAPITSCVVVPSDVLPTGLKKKRMTGDKARAMDALHDVLISNGEIVNNRYGFPDGMKCIDVEVWRQEFYARKNGSQEAKQKAFKRAMASLQDLGQIGYRDGLVWVAKGDNWKGEST